MHHPASGTFWNQIDGMLLRHFAIVQVRIFIAEGDAVVIKTHHHLGIGPNECLIFPSLVGTVKTFAREHLVVVLHLSDAFQFIKRYVSQFQHLLLVVADHEFFVNNLCRHLPIRRGRFLCSSGNGLKSRPQKNAINDSFHNICCFFDAKVRKVM